MALYRTIILIAAALTSGCATMKYGKTQIVPVDSMPAGAQVTIDQTGQKLTTPGQIVLLRDLSYTVSIEKEGYEKKTIPIVSSASDSLWRNVVWVHPLGWIVGIVVDLRTGAGYELDPNTISVTLTESTGSRSSLNHKESNEAAARSEN